ncbi:MAG: recombinase family protein [Candidatus Micrarchaeaceae archaeon]
MKNIAYLRISKKEENIENQKEAILKFANEDLIFFSDVVSGSVKTMERKGFKEMMEYIDKMKPEKLYIYEISRIARSMVEALTIIQKLELEKNVMVIPVIEKERWLTTTDKSVRNLILAIFAWIAERERELLIERTQNALEIRKEILKNGKTFVSKKGNLISKLGRPPKKIDWKKVNEYRQRNLSYSAISRLINIPYSTLIKNKNKQN